MLSTLVDKLNIPLLGFGNIDIVFLNFLMHMKKEKFQTKYLGMDCERQGT